MNRKREPFDGPIPQFAAGDRVECRDAYGNWQTMIAVGPARYDEGRGIGRGRTVWLSVPVVDPEAWALWGEAAIYRNWPAEDVRTVTP